MALKRLAFLPSFAMGLADVDEDHRALIAIGNDIAAAIEGRDFAACTALFGRFIATCRDHFVREERHLFASGFPGAAAHAAKHVELLTRAETTHAHCRNQALNRQAGDCYTKLIEFLIEDILRADMAFKSYVEHVRYRG